MRRYLPFLVAAAIIAAGVVFYFSVPAPELVRELRALPEIAIASHRGPANAKLTVVHLRDWHYVPRDLAELDGIDFDTNNAAVEKIQADQLAIARYLIKQHGVSAIYSEGLSPAALPDYRLRIDLVRDLVGDKAARALVLELGIPGRLLLSGEIKEVLPLEDADALEAAGPKVEGGRIRIDPKKAFARRQAMIANLPAEGLAVIVLAGSHDLGPHLGDDVLYVAVTPRSYPGD